MRTSIGLLLAGALLAPGAALAADTPAKDPSQKIICKSERFVGSHMSTRVCKTKAEWDEGKHRARQALDNERDKTQYEPSKPGG